MLSEEIVKGFRELLHMQVTREALQEEVVRLQKVIATLEKEEEDKILLLLTNDELRPASFVQIDETFFKIERGASIKNRIKKVEVVR